MLETSESYMGSIQRLAEGAFYASAAFFCQKLYKCVSRGFRLPWHDKNIGEAFYHGWIMGMSDESLNKLAERK